MQLLTESHFIVTREWALQIFYPELLTDVILYTRLLSSSDRRYRCWMSLYRFSFARKYSVDVHVYRNISKIRLQLGLQDFHTMFELVNCKALIKKPHSRQVWWVPLRYCTGTVPAVTYCRRASVFLKRHCWRCWFLLPFKELLYAGGDVPR